MRTAWTPEELDAIGGAREVVVTPVAADGDGDRERATSPGTPIWVVRHGDGLYARSWRGADGAWYREARRSGRARLRSADGIEHPVTVVPHAHDGDRAAVDAAYRAKYGDSPYLDAMVADAAAATTLALRPR